jgi:diguanylate cyclase (GGDEF)-like protein
MSKILFLLILAILTTICYILIKRVIRQIEDEGEVDALTLLKNKKGYYRMKNEFGKSNSVAVAFCDINNLKITNDQYGHKAGDELIISVAKAIRNNVTEGTYVYRFGGDEFVVISTEMTKKQLKDFENRLYAEFEKIELKNSPFEVRVAIGIAYEEAPVDIEKAIKDADSTMYERKKNMKAV